MCPHLKQAWRVAFAFDSNGRKWKVDENYYDEFDNNVHQSMAPLQVIKWYPIKHAQKIGYDYCNDLGDDGDGDHQYLW